MVGVLIERESSILVTGGNGFIGRHLVNKLLELDTRVTIVDKNLYQGEVRPESKTIFVNSSLSSLLKSKSIDLQEYQYVFHLAGTANVHRSVVDPLHDFRSCLEETILLLEGLRATAKAPLLIFPSSAAVYGEPVFLPIKELDPTVPLSPYGVSKLAVENYLAVYSRLYGLRSICFRPFSLYGPLQKKQVVFDFISKLRANPERLEVIGDGNQRRDFFYIDDFVSLMLHACQPNIPPGYFENYNAASGVSHSIRELLLAVCEVMAVTPEIVYSNVNRAGDPLKWSVDVTKIRQLGFHLSTPLATGLRKVVEWVIGTS